MTLVSEPVEDLTAPTAITRLREVQAQLHRAKALQTDASPRRDELVKFLVSQGYDHKTIAQAIGCESIVIYNVVKRLKLLEGSAE